MGERARVVEERDVWLNAEGGDQHVFERAQLLEAVERIGVPFDVDPSTLRLVVITPFVFNLPPFCEVPAECISVLVRSEPRLVDRRKVYDRAEFRLVDLVNALGVPADDPDEAAQ